MYNLLRNALFLDFDFKNKVPKELDGELHKLFKFLDFIYLIDVKNSYVETYTQPSDFLNGVHYSLPEFITALKTEQILFLRNSLIFEREKKLYIGNFPEIVNEVMLIAEIFNDSYLAIYKDDYFKQLSVNMTSDYFKTKYHPSKFFI